MTEPEEKATLSPHAAKRLFRQLLPLFAGYWQEAERQADEASAWKDYYRLLRACQDVLDHAPMHPGEALKLNPQRRLDRALERLATTLQSILPSGFIQLEGYVVDDLVRERRRRAGLNRYRRAKQAQNRRRKR